MSDFHKQEIDWKGAVTVLVALALSAAAGWFGQPFVHGNDEARGIIVNVFSILAGFLITVMTLLGEPGLYRGRTWRADAVKRTNVYRRLARHKWLFVIYLVVLGLVFCTSIVSRRYPDCIAVVRLEQTYLSFSAFAFIMSLLLPGRLMNLQLARFDELIAERRKGGEK